MLDGLDAIDWSKLGHAYGPAADVPAQLRAVAGSDQDGRDKALSELFGNIHHQGTVYEATSHAVPFLAWIAREGEMPQHDRAMIVALLGAIAAGRSDLDADGSLPRGSLPPEDDAAIAPEMGDAEAARAAVGHEAPDLIATLGGVDELTDWRLAQLASQVPESSSSAVPLIESLTSRTENRQLRAALELTARLIADDATPTVVDAPSPQRRSRLVAQSLYEDGFDETHAGG